MRDLSEKLRLYQLVYQKLSDFERQDFEENFTVEYTHDSTEIEGNTLSLIETRMVLTDGIVPAETRLRDVDEVREHADAWAFVRAAARERRPITEDFLRDIHQRVVSMRGVGGLYRTIPVYIRGSRHVPPAPQKLYQKMGNFVYQLTHDAFPTPIEQAAWGHAAFTRIHPFQDGNGRTARLLMNYILLTNGYPATSIKQQNVRDYFEALEAYNLTKDSAPFAALLAKYVEQTLDAFLAMYAQHLPQEKNHES